MKMPFITTGLMFALSACGGYDKNEAAYENEAGAYAQNDVNYAQDANYSAEGSAYASGEGKGWPTGSRIVVDNGTTYRIDPGGVRVALGPSDSRILVENGVRYRVDPGGTRVRIDPSGAVIAVSPGRADLSAGNTSVTVNQN